MADDPTIQSPPRTTLTEVQSELPHIPEADLLPVLSGYTVSHEIARGGMGIVFAAHDLAFARDVAIKVMHAGLDASRFVIESRVTARLAHPGVPPVHALGTLSDGRPYLVMKLIHGRTLTEELRHTDLPRLPASFEQICQTVGFAHSQGIIHRDLKPSNIMVGAFGEVQVMDWGLAKELRDADQDTVPDVPTLRTSNFLETIAGQVKGTPAFMAPEQARGEAVDARADVFALGGILAVMLTGNPPFIGNTVLDTVLKAAQAQLSDCFAQLDASGADAELISVARRCLAPDPSDRYPDGAAVAAAVSAYRAGVEERLSRAQRDRAAAEARTAEAVNTRREAEARLVEQRKRRRVQLVLAFAVLLMAVGGGAVAWWQDRQAAERKLTAQREEAERLADSEHLEADRRAVEARLVGERDAEARNKSAQAQQGVEASLRLAADLRGQYKFGQARAALSQAENLARGGAPERLAEVEQARADLSFVTELDEVRFRKWVFVIANGRGEFSTQSAPPGYRKAFAGRGLDVMTLDSVEAARRVAASSVRIETVAALDDWALYEPDAKVRERLLEIARRADPGPWTDRFRDPAVRTNKAAVAKLAAEADSAAVSSTALGGLAELMERNGLNPVPMLSAARGRYPADFQLAFVLALWQKGGRQIGPYEAARALRPEHLTTWNNLGFALYTQSDFDGAIAALRGAIRIDPAYPSPHNNLGVALYAKGDWTGAAAAWGELVRLSPLDAKAHDNLGLVRHQMGDLKGAEASYREAIRLDPKLAAAYSNLGAVYLNRDDLPEAIRWARTATQIDPTYPNAFALLGHLLFKSGDIPGARAALTEAARLNPPRYSSLLARLPPLTIAPPPREVRR